MVEGARLNNQSLFRAFASTAKIRNFCGLSWPNDENRGFWNIFIYEWRNSCLSHDFNYFPDRYKLRGKSAEMDFFRGIFGNIVRNVWSRVLARSLYTYTLIHKDTFIFTDQHLLYTSKHSYIYTSISISTDHLVSAYISSIYLVYLFTSFTPTYLQFQCKKWGINYRFNNI